MIKGSTCSNVFRLTQTHSTAWWKFAPIERRAVLAASPSPAAERSAHARRLHLPRCTSSTSVLDTICTMTTTATVRVGALAAVLCVCSSGAVGADPLAADTLVVYWVSSPTQANETLLVAGAGLANVDVTMCTSTGACSKVPAATWEQSVQVRSRTRHNAMSHAMTTHA